jgi:RNA-directed DNA polymerase
MHENREISCTSWTKDQDRSAKAINRTADMNVQEKSDCAVVPVNQPNKEERSSAETGEGRAQTEENIIQSRMRPTQSGKRMSQGLDGVRQAARARKQERFTALLHHLNVGLLRESFYALKRQASPGVDGVTWLEYETGLEDRLIDLHSRVHRGAYRAQPSRRVYIPKADGQQRPLGIAALEDKIVQQAVVTILNQIYEVDFKGFSYGFRPGRSPHQALDALTAGIQWKRVNWVLDADIRGFFDNMNHEWTGKFIEHRVADRRILRLIQKWLKAGVSEDGQWSETTIGTPQGAVASPLLANVYLHYVFDLWVEVFGRFAARNRKRRGEGKPETFTFLGLTHFCGQRISDKAFIVWRITAKKRMVAKLKAIKAELQRRKHHRTTEVGAWLRKVVLGYYQYHAVPGNSTQLRIFCRRIGWLWRSILVRRSQRAQVRWDRLSPLLTRWIPQPRILHPYPDARFAASHPR